MNIENLRNYLKNFQFRELFVESLGWDNPTDSINTSLAINGHQISYSRIAEISEVPVLKFRTEVWNKYNNNTERKKLHKTIKDKVAHQHLVLFSDDNTFFEISYLSKEEHIRRSTYFKDQSGDYFISKLKSIHFGIEDKPRITEIGKKLEQAFDKKEVTKRFYEDFKNNHFHFKKYITGIKTEEEKEWYASLILNRLMFIYFLQKKGFVDNQDFDYLQTKLDESKKRGQDKYYSEFLTCLFFEGFAKKPIERSDKAKQLLGKIKYLNGGLFVPHALEEKYATKGTGEVYKTSIKISDKAFEETFKIFSQYDWHLQSKKGKPDNEISPDVMGYIFEKYINELQQKDLGAYYTKDEITEYLSRNTIQKAVLEKINKQGYEFKSIADLLHKLTPSLCKKLLTDENSILNTLTVLDPAVGSGAFLVSAMKELMNIYSPIIGKINQTGTGQGLPFEKGATFAVSSSYNKDLKHIKKWLEDFKATHKSLAYGIKKNIILKNLYGVDIMKEAVEVCKLRLFLSLVSSALDTSELEPLPNMDFNILCGNSLIGFLREDEEKTAEDTQIAWTGILGESYQQIKDKYNQLVSRYKNQPLSFVKLKELKQRTTEFLKENNQKLNLALTDKCEKAGVKYPEILDIQGKKRLIKKRSVKPTDFYSEDNERNLNPFHWDFAFNEIMARGGFDVIITNPPWDRVQLEEKEFFSKYDKTIKRKKTKKSILDKKKEYLLKDINIKTTFLNEKNFYDFQSVYFYNLYQYQSSKIKLSEKFIKDSSTIDTYRLFIERCFDLLDKNGFLGAVLPSALCKDDGAIGLRKDLLFKKTRISGLIDFQNQMAKGQGKIFEGVDSRFKFLLLNFQKNLPGKKHEFPCHFHTRNLKILEHFPKGEKNRSQHKSKNEVVWQSIQEIKKLSSRDCSIIEFKHPMDIKTLRKVNKFSKLDEQSESWNLSICQGEFRETINPHLFNNKRNNIKYLPLYKGGAIWQYKFNFNPDKSNRYIDTCSPEVQKQKLFKDERYKNYRLVIRAISGNTNERTLVSAIIPKNSFITNTLNEIRIKNNQYKLLTLSFINSFVVDYFLRLRVSASVNPKYLMSLRIPRLTEKDKYFKELVTRSAKLTCIGKEFDELADETGIPRGDVTDQKERWKIQGEIDAMVAYIYGLNLEEFKYILSTFTTGKNQERLNALKDYAILAFETNKFLKKAS